MSSLKLTTERVQWKQRNYRRWELRGEHDYVASMVNTSTDSWVLHVYDLVNVRFDGGFAYVNARNVGTFDTREDAEIAAMHDLIARGLLDPITWAMESANDVQ